MKKTSAELKQLVMKAEATRDFETVIAIGNMGRDHPHLAKTALKSLEKIGAMPEKRNSLDDMAYVQILKICTEHREHLPFAARVVKKAKYISVAETLVHLPRDPQLCEFAAKLLPNLAHYHPYPVEQFTSYNSVRYVPIVLKELEKRALHLKTDDRTLLHINSSIFRIVRMHPSVADIAGKTLLKIATKWPQHTTFHDLRDVMQNDPSYSEKIAKAFSRSGKLDALPRFSTMIDRGIMKECAAGLSGFVDLRRVFAKSVVEENPDFDAEDQLKKIIVDCVKAVTHPDYLMPALSDAQPEDLKSLRRTFAKIAGDIPEMDSLPQILDDAVTARRMFDRRAELFPEPAIDYPPSHLMRVRPVSHKILNTGNTIVGPVLYQARQLKLAA